MRADLRDITERITAARADYVAVLATQPEHIVRYKSANVQDLLREQSDLIATGAEPCPDCKELPHGRLQHPGEPDPQAPGLWKRAPRWEISCLGCAGREKLAIEAAEKAAGADNAKQASVIVHRAQGESPESAVENWNAKRWLKVSYKTPAPKE